MTITRDKFPTGHGRLALIRKRSRAQAQHYRRDAQFRGDEHDDKGYPEKRRAGEAIHVKAGEHRILIGYDRPSKRGIEFLRQAVRIMYGTWRHRRKTEEEVMDNCAGPAENRLTAGADRNNFAASLNVESRLWRVALVGPSRDGI